MNMTAEPTVAEREPRGLGGWLVLLALNIVLLLAAYAYVATLDIQLLHFELSRTSTFGATIRSILTYTPDIFVGVVLPIGVLFLFARRHRGFPAACIVFFVSLIALALYDIALFAIANWEALRGNTALITPRFQSAAIGLALDISFLAIWTTYLKRSVRVADTFVR